jgi:tRNA(fMet)-specific endonuclease VapC
VGVVVDTSALVALERAATGWDRLLDEHRGDTLAIPAIVLAELLVGVALAGGRRADRKRASIEGLVARGTLVEFGRDLAELWSELFASLSRRGQLIPANDIAVAATALHLGFDLIVGGEDEAHFRRIPDLRIELLAV